MVELADLFRRHGPDDRARCGHRMPPSHLAAMQAIAPCRTEALGGHVSQCAECEALEYSYHACTHHHCPTCQNDDTTRWLDKQRQLLLPVPSFLVTFPLPEALRPVARSHQKWMDNLLCHTSAAALQALALDTQYLGGRIGMLGVLHPWTRDMASHPHVHSLVPGGALSPDGARWLCPRYADWLVPVRALSKIFRGKCKQELPHADLLGDVPAHVWRKPWVTHCAPAGTGTEVIASLAPSIRRIALTNNRIEQLEDGHVTFRCKQSASTQWQRRTLPADECIRRFLQHGLPQGFITVRDYGFLSPTCRPSLTHIQPLLTAAAGHLPFRHDGENPPPHAPRAVAQKTPHCTRCGGQRVLLRHPPASRTLLGSSAPPPTQ
jgi:hypothetical protein